MWTGLNSHGAEITSTELIPSYCPPCEDDKIYIGSRQYSTWSFHDSDLSFIVNNLWLVERKSQWSDNLIPNLECECLLDCQYYRDPDCDHRLPVASPSGRPYIISLAFRVIWQFPIECSMIASLHSLVDVRRLVLSIIASFGHIFRPPLLILTEGTPI